MLSRWTSMARGFSDRAPPVITCHDPKPRRKSQGRGHALSLALLMPVLILTVFHPSSALAQKSATPRAKQEFPPSTSKAVPPMKADAPPPFSAVTCTTSTGPGSWSYGPWIPLGNGQDAYGLCHNGSKPACAALNPITVTQRFLLRKTLRKTMKRTTSPEISPGIRTKR